MKNMFSLSNETPFADLMLHPEKVDAVLKSFKKTKSQFAPSGQPSRSSGQPAKSSMAGTR